MTNKFSLDNIHKDRLPTTKAFTKTSPTSIEALDLHESDDIENKGLRCTVPFELLKINETIMELLMSKYDAEDPNTANYSVRVEKVETEEQVITEEIQTEEVSAEEAIDENMELVDFNKETREREIAEGTGNPDPVYQLAVSEEEFDTIISETGIEEEKLCKLDLLVVKFGEDFFSNLQATEQE